MNVDKTLFINYKYYLLMLSLPFTLKCIHGCCRIVDAAPFLVNIFLESQLASHTVRNIVLLPGQLHTKLLFCSSILSITRVCIKCSNCLPYMICITYGHRMNG